MVQLNFDLPGFTTYEKQLARMIALLTDLRPFWPRLVPLFRQWMKQRFETEGEFGGEAWAPLSDTYREWKLWNYGDLPILTLSGQLKRHATNPKRVATPLSLSFVIEDFMRAQTKSSATGQFQSKVLMEIDWFQKGTNRMPARQIIPDRWHLALPMELQAEVEAVAGHYIEEMQKKLGLTT
jgi:hypothetical protein